MPDTPSELWRYLLSPPALIAVLIPGIVSLAILAAYAQAQRISLRLQLLWLFCLLVTLLSTHWKYQSDVHELYLVSAFSIACLVVIFNRMYISPVLIYSLTFLSLGIADTVA